jgi:prepilin peptidase CpaA
MSGLLNLDPPPLAAIAALLALAAGWDLATARIPNWLTLGAAAAALAWHAAAGGGAGLLASAAGWGLGVGLLLLPWLLGGMGAGDAKLMGAVGACLGLKGCFVAFLGTALVGAAAAVALLAWRGLLGPSLGRWKRMGALAALGQPGYEPPSGAERAPRLRYGAAIAVGTLGVLLVGGRLPAPFSLAF